MSILHTCTSLTCNNISQQRYNLVVFCAQVNLTTPMYRIARAMANPNSGLEVKDRVWLKMTIPKSFIGELRVTYVEVVTLVEVVTC